MHDSFLAALEENEDDTSTRLVYADWLEEQGEHEEADRQRRWPAAKEWMMKLIDAGNPDYGEDDEPFEDSYEYEDDGVISYEDLMKRADAAAKSYRYQISCGSNMVMCDELRGQSRQFWQNWSILTGRRLPPDIEDRAGFTCGC